jgi:regulator of protease activity HflC (stomatin/prohibitin superfamily)
MKVLCTDNINMEVDIKWIGSFSVTKNNVKIIKEKVPAVKVENGDIKGYQLSLDKFYRTAMRDIIRSTARKIIAKYSTEEVRENRDEIEQAIRTKVINKFKTLGYPIVTTDVMIANLDYPPEVTAQRKAIKNAQLEDEKQAALAKAAIAQAQRESGIAREKGKAQIERAKADAMANEIRAKSLTPEIIQMRQWDVMESLAGNGNMMIVPYEALGQSANAAMIKKSFESK